MYLLVNTKQRSMQFRTIKEMDDYMRHNNKYPEILSIKEVTEKEFRKATIMNLKVRED